MALKIKVNILKNNHQGRDRAQKSTNGRSETGRKKKPHLLAVGTRRA